MKNWVISVLLLLGVWLLLMTSLDGVVLAVGLGVVLAITLLVSARHPLFRDLRLGPKALLYMLAYPFVFVWALVKANLDVARRVVSPSLPINPAIVQVKTKLKSPIGRLVLANSITLTPGTLTVDIHDDDLFVHWIDASSTDVEAATRVIVEGFEHYLEVIYG